VVSPVFTFHQYGALYVSSKISCHSPAAILRAAGRRRAAGRDAPHARTELRAGAVNEEAGANAIAASAEAASAIGTRIWPVRTDGVVMGVWGACARHRQQSAA
jgi:hypothetical protein